MLQQYSLPFNKRLDYFDRNHNRTGRWGSRGRLGIDSMDSSGRRLTGSLKRPDVVAVVLGLVLCIAALNSLLVLLTGG